jgi:GST-like protein
VTERASIAPHRLYRLLDDCFLSREWIAGATNSIADIATWPWAAYLEQHGFAPQEHPALLRWRDRIAARLAVARMTARMGAASTIARHSASVGEPDLFFGRAATMPATNYTALTR